MASLDNSPDCILLIQVRIIPFLVIALFDIQWLTLNTVRYRFLIKITTGTLTERPFAHFFLAGSGFVLRGNAYYHQHQYEKALEAYKTALEKETLPIARWNLHNRLCATYTKLKDYDSALKEAELMIESDPGMNHTPLLHSLGTKITPRDT